MLLCRAELQERGEESETLLIPLYKKSTHCSSSHHSSASREG